MSNEGNPMHYDPVCIVTQSEYNVRTYNLNIQDVFGIVEQLFDDKATYNVVFIGAGSGVNEVNLLKLLIANNVHIKQAVFVERFMASNLIHTLEDFTNDRTCTTLWAPIIAFKFDELTSFCKNTIRECPDDKIIILGLNAGFVLKTKKEMYDCHKFLCTCEGFAQNGYVNSRFVNCFGKENGPNIAKTKQYSEDTYYTDHTWWESACDIITSTASKLTLAGLRTDEHSDQTQLHPQC